MRFFLLAILLAAPQVTLTAGIPTDPPREDDSTEWVLEPRSVDMAPLRASLTEPHFGLAKSFSTSTMKVDIGNSLDLVSFRNTKEGDRVRTSVGIDFFTYVRVTGWQGLRLQVDAVDGLFGGHLTRTFTKDERALQFRFRFLHLSAHYVDGHFDEQTQRWKDNRASVPFTRDFADLTFAYKFWNARAYALLEHAFHIRPFSQKRTWYQAGGEFYLGEYGKTGFHPYIAQDLRLTGYDGYRMNSTSAIGVKWGEPYGKGIDIFLRYYSGLGPLSEYADIHTREMSLGFSVDYW